MAEQPQTKNNAQPPQRISEVISTEGIRINPRYFVSIPGIIKIVEWVIAVICIACAAPASFGGAHWFLLVVVVFFIGSFIWMCVHFFSVPTIIPTAPWLLIELIYSGIGCVLYFIAAVVLLVQATDIKQKAQTYFIFGNSRWDAYIAAGVFGLFNCIVFGIETLFHFRAWRASKTTT